MIGTGSDERRRHHVLASRPDAHDLGLRLTDFFTDQVLGLVGILSPDAIAIANLGPAILYPKVDRPLCLARKHDSIKASSLELMGPESA